MATLQEKIAEKFLTKLATSKHVDSAKVEYLRKLLSKEKKPKADAFILIFEFPPSEDSK